MSWRVFGEPSDVSKDNVPATRDEVQYNTIRDVTQSNSVTSLITGIVMSTQHSTTLTFLSTVTAKSSVASQNRQAIFGGLRL